MLVVSQRFAVWRLTLLAEVATAGFTPFERIEGEQLRELQIVGDPSGVLQTLIQIVGRTGYGYRMPELVAQLRNRRQRAIEALFRARHAHVVPHDAAELAVNFADAAAAFHG